MFTKLQAVIPFEGPKWAEERVAQLDVDTDEGEVRITVIDRKLAAEILEVIEGASKDFELKAELEMVRKKS
jgi:hypothetical protein